MVEVPAALSAAIEEQPPRNATRHAHYSTYYDDELRELVAQKDRLVFDLCGYTFERPDA